MKNRIVINVILIVFITLLLGSCKKDDDAIILSSRLKLQTPVKTNEGLQLNWNKPYIEGLAGYYIVRYTEMPDNVNNTIYNYQYPNYYDYPQISEGKIIAILSTTNTLTYTDDNFAVSENLYYQIVGYGDTMIYSNITHFPLNDIFILKSTPNDCCFSKSQNRIYLYKASDSKVRIYDCTSNIIIDSINVNIDYTTSSYYDISIKNANNKEYLCVKNYDELEIYDLQTNSRVFSVNLSYRIGGYELDNNGHVFCSNSSNIYCYSLNSGNQIDYIYDYRIYYSSLFYKDGRIYAVENSSSYIDCIEINVNSDGTLSKITDYSINFYGTNCIYIIEKNMILSTQDGKTYSFDSDAMGQLSGDNFNYSYNINDATYDSKGDKLYLCLNSTKDISVYGSNNTKLSSITTIGYPKFVFHDGNSSIYVISSSTDYYSYSSSTKYSIEKISVQ